MSKVTKTLFIIKQRDLIIQTSGISRIRIQNANKKSF